jgi:hypothetical protein
MWATLLTLSTFPGFLGFGQNPSLLDLTKRFGNPMTIEESEDKTFQAFTFTRDSYLLTAHTDNASRVLRLQVYGVNKSVKYKDISLTSDFKTVIQKLGKPEKYVFGKRQIHVVFGDCVITVSKVGKKNYYQVVCITVNMKQETKQSEKK